MIRTPVEAADAVRAFLADLPGKVFRSVLFAFGQTGNLLALGFMFVLGVVGQPIAGPYLARYGLPAPKPPDAQASKPDAVLGQIQRLYALTGEQSQAVASIQGSLDALKTQLAKTTPLDPPPPAVKVRKIKPPAMPAAPAPQPDPSPLATVTTSVKSLLGAP